MHQVYAIHLKWVWDNFLFYYFKEFVGLAGVTQWIECWPENQRVAGSIPGQGTCLGCGPGL